MKVVLVSFYNMEAYGVRSIHSCLVRDGHDAKMLFFKMETLLYEAAVKKALQDETNSVTENEIDLFVKYIEIEKPDVVAFSLVSFHFHLFQTLCERIKDLDVKIAVGGWEASLNPERCIQYADYVCVGEGEDAFCELINTLQKREDAHYIPNIWIKCSDGVSHNSVRPLNTHLSDLPIPLFEDKYSCCIEQDRIISGEPYFSNDRYGTFIGIGCPFQCTYCSNSYMANDIYPSTWSKIRFHDADRMKTELLSVKDKLKNVKTINFYDEVFSQTVEWSKDFFSWYKKEIDIPFCCTFFPGRCSDRLCEILAQAGMKGVWLGVQSGCERVRRQIFKRFYTNEQVLNQADIFYKYGVSVRYDFIFDNPFETLEESLESIYLMLKLPQPYTMNQFSLKFFPHTVISEMALKAGYVKDYELADRSDTWQCNMQLGVNGSTMERSFIHRIVLLISFLAKHDDLIPAEIEYLIEEFRVDGTLDLIDFKLKEFL